MQTVLAIILLLAGWPFGQEPQSTGVKGEAPRNVSFCDLGQDPEAHNLATLRLTAFVTYGFEDFNIVEPNCPKTPHELSVWVTFGGDVPSGAIYCCPGEGAPQKRPGSLKVEGVAVPLVEDTAFRQFQELLKKEGDTVVRVTVIGKFFAGLKQTVEGSTYWRGYGHLGCCSLFVIQQIETFEPHSRQDVDYSADAGWYEEEGCKINSLRWLKHVHVGDREEAGPAIEVQAKTDKGVEAWRFHDPMRIATESVGPFYENQKPALRLVRKTPVRQVFRWRHEGRVTVVVVTRPYWLSFFSKSGNVPWVATMVKEAECQ